jgi:hypothetical protein
VGVNVCKGVLVIFLNGVDVIETTLVGVRVGFTVLVDLDGLGVRVISGFVVRLGVGVSEDVMELRVLVEDS